MKVERLIDPEEAAELARDCDRLTSGEIDHMTWNMIAGERGDRGMRQIPMPSFFLSHWRAHRYFERALQVARALCGQEMDYYYDQAFLKPARCGAVIPWHQDEAYWGEVGPAVTCWLALSDVEERQGCMEFVPGSQTRGLQRHEKAGLAQQYAANPEMALDHLEAVGVEVSGSIRVPLRAGDAAFHHLRTLHRTGANVTDAPRRGLATHMAAASSGPYWFLVRGG